MLPICTVYNAPYNHTGDVPILRARVGVYHHAPGEASHKGKDKGKGILNPSPCPYLTRFQTSHADASALIGSDSVGLELDSP